MTSIASTIGLSSQLKEAGTKFAGNVDCPLLSGYLLNSPSTKQGGFMKTSIALYYRAIFSTGKVFNPLTQQFESIALYYRAIFSTAPPEMQYLSGFAAPFAGEKLFLPFFSFFTSENANPIIHKPTVCKAFRHLRGKIIKKSTSARSNVCLPLFFTISYIA